MAEFAAQHRLGAEIVGIAVGMAAFKVVAGIIIRGIKARRIGAAEAAFFAAQDVAVVLVIEQAMLGCDVTRRTCKDLHPVKPS